MLDSTSKEALIGAVIFLKDSTRVNSSAGLDGSYSLKNLKPGTYTLVAQFFGYADLERKVVITDPNQIVVVDFHMAAKSMTLGQVKVISEAEKGSDDYARQKEKNADYIMNIMSAKTIQLLPDMTIGDVLQRVSGVVAEKSVTGGGKYANIRGLDKQYNYTTIDGIKIPSPDYKNRYVPMDLFPAEMVERLDVIKTLTPDMEGDAIGGVMNLVLKDAPDAFYFSADVATGYDQTLFNRGFYTYNNSVVNSQSPAQLYGPTYGAKLSDFPTANLYQKDITAPPNITSGFTIGDRFFNNKFGILASGSYQNVYSATIGVFTKPESQPDPGPYPNTPIWDYISSREVYVQQTRGAGHIKMDYEFNPKHKITFYTVYAEMTQKEVRLEDDTDNTLANSELDPHYRFQTIYEHIYNATLEGRDSLGSHLVLDWKAAYSRAWSNEPDWDDYSLLGAVGSSADVFSTLSRVWMNATDQDYSGYINLTYNFKLFGDDAMIKVGAMNRDKNRNAYYNEYDFPATPVQPNFTDIGTIVSSPNYIDWKDTLGSPQSNNTYSVQEDVTAAYGMGKIMLGKRFQLLGGVRVENTSQAYQDGEPNTIPGQSETIQYLDVLPSGQLKFIINDKQAIRLGYFASISRPSFFDLVPYQISGDYYTEVGNPNLLHSQANNYDLRYEFFPNPSDYLMAGVFLKQVYDPIEIAVLRGTGPSSTFVQPINIGGDSLSNPAINYGFELQATKYIKKFGISANYTYTHSSITVPVQIYRNTVGQSQPKEFDTSETRPMQGQVNNLANLSLIYREPKIGLEAQISVVYTGKSVSAVSLYYGLDQWQMPMTRLALSFQKRLSKKINLNLYGNINNILNTPLVVRIFPPYPYSNIPNTASWLPGQETNNGNLSSIIVEKEVYGQSYLIGLRYKF